MKETRMVKNSEVGLILQEKIFNMQFKWQISDLSIPCWSTFLKTDRYHESNNSDKYIKTKMNFMTVTKYMFTSKKYIPDQF